MDEQDSPATAQQPEGADSPGTQGQEPSRNARTPKSDPEQRLNGLMSSLGRRTSERDAAIAERDAMQQELLELRQGLDASFSGRDTKPQPQEQPEPDESPPQPTQQAPQPVAEERYTLAEARDLLERQAPTGHIDANNPSRSANSVTGEPSLSDLRRQLDAGWEQHQQRLREG